MTKTHIHPGDGHMVQSERQQLNKGNVAQGHYIPGQTTAMNQEVYHYQFIIKCWL